VPDGLAKDYQLALGAKVPDRLALVIGNADLGLEVRRGESLGQYGELVLRGRIVQAKRGSRAARYFVGPLARARLITEMRLEDGISGELLAEGTIKKTWAWPGLAGLTRGMPQLMNGTAKEVVSYLRDVRPAAGSERLGH
jgi:hypothetical protein